MTGRAPGLLRLGLAPVTQVVNGLTVAAMVLIASRRGELTDIASFATGMAVVSLAGVISGGTSVQYANGTDPERAAARLSRTLVVIPVLVVVSLALFVVYPLVNGELEPTAILLGGAFVTLNILTNLEAIDLQRHGRFRLWSTAQLVPRLLGLAALVAGLSYSSTLAASAAGSFVFMWGANMGARQAVVGPTASMRSVFTTALMLQALAEAALLRVTTISAPAVSDAQSAGAFIIIWSIVLSVQTLATSVLIAVMNLRGQFPVNQRLQRYRRFEALVVAGMTPLGVVLVAGAGVGIQLFNLDHVPNAELVWMLLMASLVPITVNRLLQFRDLSAGATRAASTRVVLIAVLSTAVCMLALAMHSLVVLSTATVVSEAVVLSALALTKRRQTARKVLG